MVEVPVLGEDVEAVGFRKIPNIRVVGGFEAKVLHMSRAGENVLQSPGQFRR